MNISITYELFNIIEDTKKIQQLSIYKLMYPRNHCRRLPIAGESKHLLYIYLKKYLINIFMSQNISIPFVKVDIWCHWTEIDKNDYLLFVLDVPLKRILKYYN